MRFDAPATPNPIDRQRVVGRPIDRIDGKAKVMGAARYAYERHDAVPNAAYGVIVGAAIATGRIRRLDTKDAERAQGVLAVVTYLNAGPLGKGETNTAHLLAGPGIEHYDQAVALVVAESFEQARHAASLVRIDYEARPGRYDLARARADAIKPAALQPPGTPDTSAGDFTSAFESAPIKIDQEYTTPDQSHMMMEPHATTAAWSGDKLTVWTSNQMLAGGVRDLAATLRIPANSIRMIAPYVGGGFGAKLFIRCEVVLAALGARAARRPVKVALTRPQIMNNATHRPATIQRVRIGASPDGLIEAIAHESWSGDLPGGKPETAAVVTRLLYAGKNRLTAHRLAQLDLPEGNSMRAPGEAPGMMALEIAMDELAEAAGIDPVELRIINDIQYDPEKGPGRQFSSRKLVECLRTGAQSFGWSRRRATPRAVVEGEWLIGMGMASAFRGNVTRPSAARAHLDARGVVTIETDMTDIGTGSYTIIAQTAAEMMGVDLDRVVVRLGDSVFPESAGSGGQFGGNSSTAGVYAACSALRDAVCQRAGLTVEQAIYQDGAVRGNGRSFSLAKIAGPDGLTTEDKIEFGDLAKTYAQATFGAHFCEAAVNRFTGEIRVRRMFGAFAAGRILNPKTARSQVIGAMTMGLGAALMEEAVVDKRFGYFVNHDLAEYHVPVHADSPIHDVVFVEELDEKSSPMKAKGVGELGICGAAAAIANAVYNASAIRVRDYPLSLDKFIGRV